MTKVKFITESELRREQSVNELKSLWPTLSREEKEFVFECMMYLTPNSKKILSEAKWYNTIGDIVGIFDPTGIVDLINGISYFKQGDKFFGFLSLISAVPYIGDLVAKPLLLGKVGKGTMGAFKAATLAKDTTKMASIATKEGGALGKLVTEAPTWGSKLLGMLEKAKNIPLVGSLFRLIEQWVTLFKGASAEVKVGAKIAGKAEGLAAKEAGQLGKVLNNKAGRHFRDFGIENFSKATKFFKNLGWWRNPQLSMLIGKTKAWASFLDYMNLGNFVGPEELANSMGEEKVSEEFENFAETEEGQEAWKDDFSKIDSNSSESSETQMSSNNSEVGEKDKQDPLGFLMKAVSLI